MEILFLSVILGFISQTNIVSGVHSSVSSGDVRGYRDTSTRDSQQHHDVSTRDSQRYRDERFTSNRLTPARANNRRSWPQNMPRFIDRRIFQHPRHDSMAFQRFSRNRQRSRPILTQPLARPLGFQSLNFRKISPTSRQFNSRKPFRVGNGDRMTFFPLKLVSGTNDPTVDEIKMTEKNSLLTLLEERRAVIRDDNDLILIRKHLVNINNMGSNSRLNQDQMLEKQVEYIENITDTDIQREVLKIFVKDIVEKSGFLSQNLSRVHDIDALKALVDKISSVTDKFSQLSPKLAIDSLSLLGVQDGLDMAQNNVAPITRGQSTTVTARVTDLQHVTDSEHSLRQKILNALSIYDKSAHVIHKPVEINDKGLETFRSRPISEPMPGMSIFGDVTTVTTNSATTENKRGQVVTEPLGGNNAYWTHLRAGLVDMLCNLCRQQNLASCVVRYCSNDLIRTETETPAPSVVITAKQAL